LLKDGLCPLHSILDPFRNNIVENLKTKSIKVLVSNVQEGNSFLPF